MNKDHAKAERQIKDYLDNYGWEAYCEKRLGLLEGKDYIKDEYGYIVVDVFAIKNGKTYVCEVGQTNSKERLRQLDRFFDIVEHIPLDRSKFRAEMWRRNDWDKLQKIATYLSERDIFGPNEHHPVFKPEKQQKVVL